MVCSIRVGGGLGQGDLPQDTLEYLSKADVKSAREITRRPCFPKYFILLRIRRQVDELLGQRDGRANLHQLEEAGPRGSGVKAGGAPETERGQDEQFKGNQGTSLVVQRLRIRLARQGTPV